MSIAWLSVSDPDQYARTILRREAAMTGVMGRRFLGVADPVVSGDRHQLREVRRVYTPAAVFRRTAEERADQELAWRRTDQATFCADHRHRAPEYFHQDPRPRARAYLDRFPLSPDA